MSDKIKPVTDVKIPSKDDIRYSYVQKRACWQQIRDLLLLCHEQDNKELLNIRYVGVSHMSGLTMICVYWYKCSFLPVL